MSKNFLITSHTQGLYPFEQEALLEGLVVALKKYFPDCFVLVASQSPVSSEVQAIADYVVVDRSTVNFPYGAGEVALITAGLDVMEQFGKKDCFKIVYDFVINDSNYTLFDQWLNHNKDFVGCYWKTDGLGIGSWIWYGTVEMQRAAIDFDSLDHYLEKKILNSFESKQLLDRCYIYDDHHAMFNGDWFENCDLVHSGGSVLKHFYGTVSVVIELSDLNQSLVPFTIQSLIEQIKKPNHLVIVDARTVKSDLRNDTLYQRLFSGLNNAGISWNLIYYVDQSHILKHLEDLGYTWCWFVDPYKDIPNSALGSLYKKIILDRSLALVSSEKNGVLYKNYSLKFGEINTSAQQYILDEMENRQYNKCIV